MANADVLLLSLPWASLEQPSLALGQIKSLLARGGVSAEVRYLNLEFAETVGPALYRSLKDRDVMACEWIFAEAMFGALPDADAFLHFLRRSGHSEEDTTHWGIVQRAAVGFIDRCANSIDWSRYKVVGFTTTMIQTVASLALARRIRDRHPDVRIVFGGANCEDEMGAALIENFDFIDVVVRRDCDGFVAELFRRLVDGDSVRDLPVCDRLDGVVRIGRPPEMFAQLDSNPYPDYDEYFEQLRGRSYGTDIRVNVVFEGSRGCWFGMKSHCTFCGLNGSTMAYRSKSAARLVDELAYLSERHNVKWFGAADNILDHKQQTEICAGLTERIPGAKLFFDVKVNLKRSQLAAMKRAGIDEVQPGIESFSTRVLKLMKKGTTGIFNVYFLRMCAELGIWPMWNYLYGFPGESIEDYQPILEWTTPALFHLPAPYVGFALSLQRFSPYFERPGEMGIEIKGPLPHYRFIYPLAWEQVARLAYYFEFAYSDGYDPRPVGTMVEEMARQWNYAYYVEKRTLTAIVDDEGNVVLRDSRFGAERTHVLASEVGALYRHVEHPILPEHAAAALRTESPEQYLRLGGTKGVAAAIDWLHEQKLVFREGRHVVALAVPLTPASFWRLPDDDLSDTSNTVRPRPALLHWKVDHLYS